jgi:hypothetical protein
MWSLFKLVRITNVPTNWSHWRLAAAFSPNFFNSVNTFCILRLSNHLTVETNGFFGLNHVWFFKSWLHILIMTADDFHNRLYYCSVTPQCYIVHMYIHIIYILTPLQARTYVSMYLSTMYRRSKIYFLSNWKDIWIFDWALMKLTSYSLFMKI